GGPILLFGSIVYIATRHDFAWVELDRNILFARHLYSGKVIVRKISEIEELITHVFLVRTEISQVHEALFGRIRGIEIRFGDGRTPLRVWRADPAMTNALSFMQALIF